MSLIVICVCIFIFLQTRIIVLQNQCFLPNWYDQNKIQMILFILCWVFLIVLVPNMHYSCKAHWHNIAA